MIQQNLVEEGQRKSFSDLYRILGSKLIDEEWKYFQKYARCFDSNSIDKRYGILIMGTKYTIENMIYESDPKLLRILHLNKLSLLGTGSIGH